MKPNHFNILNTLAALAPPTAVALIWVFELAMSSRLALTKAMAPQLWQKIDVPSTGSTVNLPSSLGISEVHQIKCGNMPKDVKVWISPYQPFPEAGNPGDYASRGLGEYQYLSLLRGDRCTKVKSNYGAFKYSPAHKVFEKASNQGIAAELAEAKKLDFETFALDLNRAWITSDDLKNQCQASSACRITSDNFALVHLKEAKALPGIIKALHHVKKKPYRVPTEYFRELIGFNSNEWQPIEASPDGKSFWSWSNEFGLNRTFTLAGKRLAALPINLEIILKPAPTIAKVDLRMICTHGQDMHRLTVNKDISISHLLRDCQPETIEVEGFSTRNSEGKAMPTLQVPPLGPGDIRRSLFAIKAVQ